MTSRDWLIQCWWMSSFIPFICWVYMFYWHYIVSTVVCILSFSQSFSLCILYAKQEWLSPHRRQGKLNHNDVKGHPSNQRQMWEQNTDFRDMGFKGTLIIKSAVHTKERGKNETELELQSYSINVTLFYRFRIRDCHQLTKIGQAKEQIKEHRLPNSPYTQCIKILATLHFNRLPGDSVVWLCLSPWIYGMAKVSNLPWLAWLSGLSIIPQTKRSLVHSQSGHTPGLRAESPVGGCVRGNHTLMFLSLSFSLPSPLCKNK